MDKATILIVDDEQVGREALEAVLFPEGFQLIFAENGQEAYEKALAYLPDVILLDVMMPGMDGYQVCRKIRKDPLLSEIPVLMVTALDDRVSRITGIDAGADDFITKPFDRVEIRVRIRTIVRLNRYRTLLVERARFAWVVEQAQEGYVILDPEDHILYANPAAQQLLHLPVQSGGIVFLDHVKEQYHPEPEEIWQNWPKVDGTNLLLVKPETRHSPSTYLSVQALALQSGDKQRRLLRITDVTEKFSLEREVWTFQQMMSHKLQTPVAQILMAAELIHHQATKQNLTEMAEISTAMLSGARRLEGEVREILHSIHIGDTVNTGSQVSMQELQKIVTSLCREIGIEQFHVHYERTLDPYSLPLSYRAMESIFREIIENAKKFHPRLSPTLEIELLAFPGALPEEPKMIARVKDDGISLSPEQLRNVWRPYYQAEKDLTGEVAGMGLGLTCVANLVWQVGGKYRMYNRSEQTGIVVELIFPLA